MARADRRRRRPRSLVAAAAVVGLVAVAAVIALAATGDPSDDRRAVRARARPSSGEAGPVSLARTTGLVDGERVEVRVRGLVPGTTLSWEVCDAPLRRCGASDASVDEADAHGRLRIEARLWRMVGVHGAEPGAGGTLDCAVDVCRLRFWGETASGRDLPVVDVAFDPAHGERRPPAAELLDEGPFRPGEVVRIGLSGVGPGVVVDALLCNPHGGECVGAGATGGSGDPVIELALPQVPGQWRQGCERCPITFGGYYVDDPAGRPPLLNADTLWITIAG